MDAFAVSISSGVVLRRMILRIALKISFAFGLFQAVMPLIGYGLSISFKKYIESSDHWIAFLALSIIGIKMIYESLSGKNENERINICSNYMIFILAIATSIDALAVGISFAVIKTPLILAISVIGLTTFVISFLGIYIGLKSGDHLGKKAEILGGLVLIFIGSKILFQHLGFIG
ncbi:MAG: manganese efflux pump MntP family protein [Bacteroidota bacterium]|nr:manganese efflux pump MntP family protein [Bacteroidota bacterium]